MKVVYIAGKFRGPDAWAVAQNVRAAEHVAYLVATHGAMPLCPHANTAHFDGTLTDQFWIDGTLELLKRCDALILVPGWEASTGAQGERAWALEHDVPVFETFVQLSEWLDRGDGA